MLVNIPAPWSIWASLVSSSMIFFVHRGAAFASSMTPRMAESMHSTTCEVTRDTGSYSNITSIQMLDPPQSPTITCWLVALSHLKNMKVSWGYYSQYLEKHMFETNNYLVYLILFG
jgi:hypothetical protein